MSKYLALLFVALMLSACGSDTPDECGGTVENGAYSCAYLTGSCTTPGLSCFCWERGTMVCQADHAWSLILDVGNCPQKASDASYEGLGCLGAAATCTDSDGTRCSCDATTHVYHCATP